MPVKKTTKKPLIDVVADMSLPTEKELSNISKKEVSEYLENFAINNIKRSKLEQKIIEAFHAIEIRDLCVNDVVMNAMDFALLRMFKGLMEIETDGEKLKYGYVSRIYNARIWIRQSASKVYFFPENSSALLKLFPDVVRDKKILGYTD